MPLVSVVDVSRSYGRQRVLDGVQLDVDAGQIVALLGPSGAGKTTLVRLVAGADRPQGGSVRVLDRDMPDIDVLSKIGYMAQSDALYLELTGRENLDFFGALCGRSDRASIESAAAVVGLGGELAKPVLHYSGGMKRRLSLAIAMLHEPPVLILDEPTVGIDPILRRSVWVELRRYAAAGRAILLTTHVMDEAEKCDRVAMLRDGRVIASDSPAGLKAAAGAATLEEAFLHFGRAA